jgi:hypothetical protein
MHKIKDKLFLAPELTTGTEGKTVFEVMKTYFKILTYLLHGAESFLTS